MYIYTYICVYLYTYMYPPKWRAVRDKPSRFRTGSDSTGRRARGSTSVSACLCVTPGDVCVCVCVCVCVDACMYVCMYGYICVYIYMYIQQDTVYIQQDTVNRTLSYTRN